MRHQFLHWNLKVFCALVLPPEQKIVGQVGMVGQMLGGQVTGRGIKQHMKAVVGILKELRWMR